MEIDHFGQKVSLRRALIFVGILITTIISPHLLFAESKRGIFSLGILGGYTHSKQSFLQTLSERAEIRAGDPGHIKGTLSTNLNRGSELAPFLQWKLSSIFAFQVRPSLFHQSLELKGGSGASAGDYLYQTNGYAITGLFKMYVIEVFQLHLALQGGVAYGALTTKIKELDYESTSNGSNLGYVGGASLEICLYPNCFYFEGNFRNILIDRNIVSNTKGTPASNSVSQSALYQELEIDNRDLATNMSGFQAMFGYGLHF